MPVQAHVHHGRVIVVSREGVPECVGASALPAPRHAAAVAHPTTASGNRRLAIEGPKTVPAKPRRALELFCQALAYTACVIIGLSMVPVVFLVAHEFGIDFMANLGYYLSAPQELIWHFCAWFMLTLSSGVISLFYHIKSLDRHGGVNVKLAWGTALVLNVIVFFLYCLYELWALSS